MEQDTIICINKAMKTKTPVIVILLLIAQQMSAQSVSTGPTAYFGYDGQTIIKNPIDVFMYFVPLTSPARVTLEKSTESGQVAWITSYSLKTKKDRFEVRCEFTINGDGFFVNTFNHADIIDMNTRYREKLDTTTHLDYMRFDGGGYGAIEISGNYINGNPDLTELRIDFAAGSEKSPVTIGLYSIDPVDGSYDYENRYNITRARVSSLSFKKTQSDERPRMEVRLSTLGNEASADGFIASVKGLVANLFISPVVITQHGNDTLFDFATAIYLRESKFTFPLAKNVVN